MLYLTGSLPRSPDVEARLRSLPVGVLVTYRTGYSPDRLASWTWAADNGCFGSKWDRAAWAGWLRRMVSVEGCIFAVVPDVVGSHRSTKRLWRRWAGFVRHLGYVPAFVAQNGCHVEAVPWDSAGAIFLGGDDTFKLGPDAERITRHAVACGIPVHMGRVNSYKRLALAASWGCSSTDGTFLAFGPDQNVGRVEGWFRKLEALRVT